MTDTRARTAKGWLFAGGGIALLGAGFAMSARAAFGGLVATWLFVTGAALGSLIVLAASEIAEGRWADRLVPACSAGIRLLPWSFGGLVVLVAASARWAPWPESAPADHRWWLNVPFFAVRSLLGAAVLFGLARTYARRRLEGTPAKRIAIAFCLSFVIVLTLWALDFVLAMDPTWSDALIGAFYFMSSFLGGAAIASLAASVRPEDGDLRHDIGKLLFGLAVFWAYLGWAQFLTIWYGNLPDETEFLVVRHAAVWQTLGLVCVALIFVGPFTGLMRESAKRNPKLLRVGASAVLLGLWLSFQWLVVPSLSSSPSAASVLAGLGALGILLAPLPGDALVTSPAAG